MTAGLTDQASFKTRLCKLSLSLFAEAHLICTPHQTCSNGPTKLSTNTVCFQYAMHLLPKKEVQSFAALHDMSIVLCCTDSWAAYLAVQLLSTA